MSTPFPRASSEAASGQHRETGDGGRRDRRQICSTILRVLADEYAIDPLLIMCLVAGAEPLLEHTLIGHRLLRGVLEVVGDNPCDPYYLEPWEIVEAYRDEICAKDVWASVRFYTVNQEKAVALQCSRSSGRGGRDSSAGGGSFKDASSKLTRSGRSFTGSKNCILADMMISHHLAKADYVYACLVQVVFRSGSRVNEVYRDASECLVACRNRLRPPERDMVDDENNSVLSIVEVPNKLQRTYKLYVDWEVLTSWFDDDFFGGPDGQAVPERDKVQFLRNLAQGCPSAIVRVFSELGILLPTSEAPSPRGPGACVQVAVTEGTRWVEDEGCHKISLHFVFQIFVTRPQFVGAWEAFVDHLNKECGALVRFLGLLAEASSASEKRAATRECLPGVPSRYLPLIGVDKHCWTNLEQGLAFPLSRKRVGDERSRFVKIVHLRRGDGLEMLSEIPCKRTWCAHLPISSPGPKPRDMDPAMLLDALLVVSICLPSPRCIGVSGSLPPADAAAEEKRGDDWGHIADPAAHLDIHDSSSRCSLASTVRPPSVDREEEAEDRVVQKLTLASSRARAAHSKQHQAPAVAAPHQLYGGEGGGPCWRLSGLQRSAIMSARGGKAGCYDAGWMRRAGIGLKGELRRAAGGDPGPGDEERCCKRARGGEPCAGGGKRKRGGDRLLGDWEDHPKRAAICKIPGWFLSILRDKCPGFADSLTTGMRYGSRPSCARGIGAAEGGDGSDRRTLLFQLNKCSACLCVGRMMQVPFRGHATHTSNGTLFYVDGKDVYATCLKEGCKAAMLSRREGYCLLANRLQRLILHEEPLVDGLDKSSYFREKVGPSGLALLEAVEGAVEAKATRARNGSSPAVPGEAAQGPGGREPCLSLSSFAKVPAGMMCNSLNGKRTWVCLTEGMLLDYFEHVAALEQGDERGGMSGTPGA